MTKMFRCAICHLLSISLANPRDGGATAGARENQDSDAIYGPDGAIAGAAIMVKTISSFEADLKQFDRRQALYRAKINGRNRVEFASQDALRELACHAMGGRQRRFKRHLVFHHA